MKEAPGIGPDKHEQYFQYLRSISTVGRLYKRLWSSPILFLCGRVYGPRLIEVGSGTGAGILGAFPSSVTGLEINRQAVAYTHSLGLKAELIEEGAPFPLPDAYCDACVLDNVLEHIDDPTQIIGECWRVTKPKGGLVIAVPGIRGFARDPDHKAFYGSTELGSLDMRWKMTISFSLPLLVKSTWLSRSMRQYCTVAAYRKTEGQRG